jgi:hypothetical protein
MSRYEVPLTGMSVTLVFGDQALQVLADWEAGDDGCVQVDEAGDMWMWLAGVPYQVHVQ